MERPFERIQGISMADKAGIVLAIKYYHFKIKTSLPIFLAPIFFEFARYAV